MILNGFPDVPPLPLTNANQAFRAAFYARWGKENAVVLGTTRKAEFAPYTQCLSLKRCWGGHEDYFTRRRKLRVDDAHFLILNAGQNYGAAIQSSEPVISLAVFFRPGMAEEYLAARLMSLGQALDAEADLPRRATAFAEHLRPCERDLEAALTALRRAVAAGERNEWWLEEQCQGLLELMLAHERHFAARSAPLEACGRSSHRELLERVDTAADYLLSCSSEPVSLEQLAAVARLSKYHLLRTFKQVHGVTPYVFLNAARVRNALRLLDAGDLTVEQVAQRCGFGSRFTLYRQLRRHRAGYGARLPESRS